MKLGHRVTKPPQTYVTLFIQPCTYPHVCVICGREAEQWLVHVCDEDRRITGAICTTHPIDALLG